MSQAPLSISWAVTTDKGLRRTSNEDSHCERADIGLFVVADGMGGHVAGEVASTLALAVLRQHMPDIRDAADVERAITEADTGVYPTRRDPPDGYERSAGGGPAPRGTRGKPRSRGWCGQAGAA